MGNKTNNKHQHNLPSPFGLYARTHSCGTFTPAAASAKLRSAKTEALASEEPKKKTGGGGSCWNLVFFFEFYRVSLGFYRVLLGFYRVLLGFYRVFYRVL